MLSKIAAWLIKILTPLAYVKMTVDAVNKKLVEPLAGLPGYYRFVSPADMPQARFVHYMHLVKRLSMNVDEELLNRYLTLLTRAFEEGEKEKFHGAMYMLKDTMATIRPTETYYWLAALMYFKKDEDISTFDFDVNVRKVNFFKGLPNQTFFLATLLNRLNVSGSQSLEEIETYLKESQVKAESYGRILTEMNK